MKTLNTFIIEKLKITKDIKIFKSSVVLNNKDYDIDISKYKYGIWNGIDDLVKCRQNVEKFAIKIYNNNKPIKTFGKLYELLKLLFKDTYKLYLSTLKYSESDINRRYDEMIQKSDNAYDWSQFANTYVEKGWFYFVEWISKNID